MLSPIPWAGTSPQMFFQCSKHCLVSLVKILHDPAPHLTFHIGKWLDFECHSAARIITWLPHAWIVGWCHCFLCYSHHGTQDETPLDLRRRWITIQLFIPLLVWLITKRAITQQYFFMQYLRSHIPLHDKPANLAMAMTGNGCIHTYVHTCAHTQSPHWHEKTRHWTRGIMFFVKDNGKKTHHYYLLIHHCVSHAVTLRASLIQWGGMTCPCLLCGTDRDTTHHSDKQAMRMMTMCHKACAKTFMFGDSHISQLYDKNSEKTTLTYCEHQHQPNRFKNDKWFQTFT